MSKKNKNKNAKKSNPWKGYPDYLSRAMTKAYLSEISPDVVVEALQAELTLARDGADADEILQRLCWIDRFFVDTMVDSDVHYDSWRNNAQAIATLLNDAEKRLFDLCRSGKTGLRSHVLPEATQDATALCQRLNAYLCISAIILGDETEREKRIERIVRDTCANISYLLSQEDSRDLFKRYEEHDLDIYIPNQRIFSQPLDLLCAAFGELGYETEKVQPIKEAFKKYIRFLTAQEADPSGIRGRLIADAEVRYGELCDWIAYMAMPDFPRCFIDGDEIKRVAAEHPDLPMAIFVKHGKSWTYAEVTSVSVLEVLNGNPPYYDDSQPLTSRKRLQEMVEQRLVKEGNDPAAISKAEWDEKVAQALEHYNDRWENVIAIEVELKEA